MVWFFSAIVIVSLVLRLVIGDRPVFCPLPIYNFVLERTTLRPNNIKVSRQIIIRLNLADDLEKTYLRGD